MKKIYVGNLPWTATESELQELFETCGTVHSTAVITDRETGRSRGFAFVEMGSEEDARAAIEAMDGTELDGRALRVNEAQEREQRGGGGRGHGGGGGGGGW